MSFLPLPTVLTVENDPAERADLRLVLEDGGFAVCADACDGVEAVELAREHRPDVILFNLNVPCADGIEAVQRIRQESDVPIVALLGRRRGKLIEHAADAAALASTPKPSAEREVVDALRHALSTYAERALSDAREESHQTFTEVLRVLGYPEDFASQLERLSYEQGRAWRWILR